MDEEAYAPDAEPRRRPHFRFGLKTLFFITTALCLWLSYKYLRERRVADIIARHDAVMAALLSQIDSAHLFKIPAITPGVEDQLLYGQRAVELRVNHGDSTTSQKIVVDVSKLLDAKTHPTTVADQLVQYYGTALKPLGFLQIHSEGDTTSYGRAGVDVTLGSAREIWASSNGDMNVVIEGQVFEPSQQALVTIILLDSQQPNLWVDPQPKAARRPAH